MDFCFTCETVFQLIKKLHSFAIMSELVNSTEIFPSHTVNKLQEVVKQVADTIIDF